MQSLKKILSRMNYSDKILIIIIILLSLIGIFYSFFHIGNAAQENPENMDKYILIESENGKEKFSIQKNKIIEIEGPLGISKAKISEGQIEMIESPCSHNICVNTPPLDSRHGTIACLPNDIIIKIESNEDDID